MIKGISSLGLIVGGGFRIGSLSNRVGVVVPRTRLYSLGGLRASSSSAAADEAATEKYDTEDDAPELLDVEYRGKKISVERGTILRTALLRNGVSPHNGQAMYVNCRYVGWGDFFSLSMTLRVVFYIGSFLQGSHIVMHPETGQSLVSLQF
jgi:hypothetical protein